MGDRSQVRIKGRDGHITLSGKWVGGFMMLQVVEHLKTYDFSSPECLGRMTESDKAWLLKSQEEEWSADLLRHLFRVITGIDHVDINEPMNWAGTCAGIDTLVVDLPAQQLFYTDSSFREVLSQWSFEELKTADFYYYDNAFYEGQDPRYQSCYGG